MKKIKSVLFLACFVLLFSLNNYAQTKAVITIDELTETKEGLLIIKYSLANFKNNELFDVELIVKKGYNSMNPISVTGDIGKNIDGNGTKTITWDLIKDNVILSEYINVQLIATAREDISQLKMTNLLLSSTFFPGSGLKKLDKTKNYNLLGITGYSLIGSAVLFNVLANVSYNLYLSETDMNLRQNYYTGVSIFRYTSYFSIFSAASVWITDYIWLMSKKRNLDKKYSFLDRKINLKIGATYNTFANEPMVNLKFYF